MNNIEATCKTPTYELKQGLAQSFPTLLGMSRADLSSYLASVGAENYRLSQLWHWLYVKRVKNFNEMSSLGKNLRNQIIEHWSLERPRIVREERSLDGTRKWLLGVSDGHEIETVYIPETARGTLCISSQVGCTLSCRFCHTGTQKWVRNLTAGEIVGQVMLALDQLSDCGLRPITNIVLMGMGEPLYNYENIAKAMKIIMDNEGLAFSKRRITLSTAGVVPMMETCGQELGVNLAVSLHATNNEVRDIIVPLNKKYPIEDLLGACRNYPGINNARRITFEYVMLKGINDSSSDAKELLKIIKGIPSKINLIPFNPWPGSTYECSDEETINKFAEILMKAGYASPIRTPRGRDILAACGQLKSESQKLRASQRNENLEFI